MKALGLSKVFNSKEEPIRILSDLDLTVEAGDSVAVVGASGIGKSTLLHVLGALDRPDSGKLFVDGEDVFSLPDKALARFRNRAVGFVFQFHHLLPEFTALENTAIPLMISGVGKKAAKDRAKEVLDRVGLGHRLGHRVSELSGGEQQRVALARALVGDPGLLLADEPTGNLDEKTAGKIHELLVSLNENLGMTLIAVTHNPAFAALMRRRVTLSEGRIAEL
ncbi:MAG: ABC transporter ATP-binding protein [Deltaproteobacteria bacterium]|nr:ABC transporter ATP-binding protein [Deltaproteobacteria bacterium]